MTSVLNDGEGKYFSAEKLNDGNDNIKKPNHYTWHPVAECREIVQEFDYNLGVAMAYIWRAGRKDGNSYVQDISKAIEHLSFEIDRKDKETYV